jgi:diguanylate cyclase (GGDEF)-like protein
MDTQSVFYLAIVVNVVVLVVVLVVPRMFGRGSRSARQMTAGKADRSRSEAQSGSPLPHASAAISAAPGEPWFPAHAGAGPARSASDDSTADPMTGLDRTPSWARWLAEEEARVQRFHRPATIVLVELTGLDRLAERLGDGAAERLIPPIAKTMRRYARATDQVARLGPTRFGALLSETDDIQAINYIERIRSACDVWLEAGAVMLRLSVGWAEFGPDRPKDLALREAEGRLFTEREKTRSQLSWQRDDRTLEMPGLPQAGT